MYHRVHTVTVREVSVVVEHVLASPPDVHKRLYWIVRERVDSRREYAYDTLDDAVMAYNGIN